MAVEKGTQSSDFTEFLCSSNAESIAYEHIFAFGQLEKTRARTATHAGIHDPLTIPCAVLQFGGTPWLAALIAKKTLQVVDKNVTKVPS